MFFLLAAQPPGTKRGQGKEVLAALREAGLEVLEFRDLARDGDWPW